MFIVGDNLGLNTILSFSKGFNTQYYYWICKITKKNAQNFVKEEREYTRTQNDYFNCVINSKIKRKNVFLIRSRIFTYWKIYVDPMHDLLKGICRYDFSKIFLKYK